MFYAVRTKDGCVYITWEGPYDYDHECLLWGVDVEEKTFQSSGYVRGKIYAV